MFLFVWNKFSRQLLCDTCHCHAILWAKLNVGTWIHHDSIIIPYSMPISIRLIHSRHGHTHIFWNSLHNELIYFILFNFFFCKRNLFATRDAMMIEALERKHKALHCHYRNHQNHHKKNTRTIHTERISALEHTISTFNRVKSKRRTLVLHDKIQVAGFKYAQRLVAKVLCAKKKNTTKIKRKEEKNSKKYHTEYHTLI